MLEGPEGGWKETKEVELPLVYLYYLAVDNGTDRLFRNVGTYQSTLRNIPEELRSQVKIIYNIILFFYNLIPLNIHKV